MFYHFLNIMILFKPDQNGRNDNDNFEGVNSNGNFVTGIYVF